MFQKANAEWSASFIICTMEPTKIFRPGATSDWSASTPLQLPNAESPPQTRVGYNILTNQSDGGNSDRATAMFQVVITLQQIASGATERLPFI